MNTSECSSVIFWVGQLILRWPENIVGQIRQKFLFLRKCDIIPESALGRSVRGKLCSSVTSLSLVLRIWTSWTVGCFKIILIGNVRVVRANVVILFIASSAGPFLLNLKLLYGVAKRIKYWYQTLQCLSGMSGGGKIVFAAGFDRFKPAGRNSCRQKKGKYSNDLCCYLSG